MPFEGAAAVEVAATAPETGVIAALGVGPFLYTPEAWAAFLVGAHDAAAFAAEILIR